MKRKTILINHHKIEYLNEGQGTPVLFLHGGGASYRNYKGFLAELSEAYNVFALSYPGSGRSSGIPKDWKFEDYGPIIIEFCKALNIKPYLLGHSFGGGIAMVSKALNPDAFEGIVLLAPAGLIVDLPPHALARVIKYKVSTLFRFDYVASATLINAIFNLRGSLRIAKIFKDTSLKNYMNQLTEQVFVFWATKDEIFPFDDYPQRFASNIAAIKTYEVDNVHSFINLESKFIISKLRDIIK